MRILLFFCSFLLLSCKQTPPTYEVLLKEMSDAEYPDNPNLEARHSEAKQYFFKNIVFHWRENNLFDAEINSHQAGECTISLKNLPLLEMMPTAPEHIKSDKYLTYIGLVNQEWNRQQTQFQPGQFEVHGKQKFKITRVDLANNCLNAYLWEILVYAKDSDGNDKLFWQCWFDFPKEVYKHLFEVRNNLNYEDYRQALENWINPESKPIDLSQLRRVLNEKEISFTTKNNEMYPKEGERKRKFKNIITPVACSRINDLLNDSTKFATFSIPGYYNRKDPRKTELSKLGLLKKVLKREVIDAHGKKSIELELHFFSNIDQKTMTKFIMGDMDMSLIPTLSEAEANSGWQTSMGISNHSFYETFDFQQTHLTKDNGFYAFLTDENNNWLDSHKIGIDGPLLHFDQQHISKLHFWTLAFERHAFVGHYVLDF